MENEQNKIFIKKFNLEQHGFYNLTPFTDGSVGFSVKKNLIIKMTMQHYYTYSSRKTF